METATFGSEFVAATTAVDLIIGLRTTLMHFGIPVNAKSYMFGDNKAVVNNACIPTSVLFNRSHLAGYHQVRQAIAAGCLLFSWKDGKSNYPKQALWIFHHLSIASTHTLLAWRHC